MANSALIDDLLKQFADNPRRVFARLANEYRKRGELDSAIEICRSHVPLQPGYISGHIVLGQALFDSGSLEEARSTFETALALDPENLIALRHMGDIASANGEVERARAWYRQLLEIDPQNDEVVGQLESLGAPAQAEAAASTAAPEELSWGEVSPETIDISAAESVAAESIPAAKVDADTTATAGDAGTTDDALEIEEIFELTTSEDDEPTREAKPVPVVEGLEVTAFQDDDGAESSPLELVELDELTASTADAREDTPETSHEDTPETSVVAVETASAHGSVAPLFPADSDDLAIATASDDDAAASAFATETMAELYLQQGFPDRALAIYRELAARDPDNSSLRERIAELTETENPAPAPVPAAKGSRTAREFFGVLAYRRAPRAGGNEDVPPLAADATPEREPEDVEQGGVEGASDLAAAAHASEHGAAADSVSEATPVEAGNGKPGREAASALSLDDVFRDSQMADGSGSKRGLSFDEFFSRRANGAAERPNGTVATEVNDGATGEERSSENEPEDLELFHAWLDGLKG